MRNRFEEQLALYAKQTNDALRDLLHTEGSLRQIAVFDAMRYSLLDAGKRIRAALTLEFGRLTGANREGAMALACAVEMVHAYSLIHDDLPCMDNDDYRRGKPSCHKTYGEANALLAGDGLLTFAFAAIAGAPIPDGQRIQAVQVLSRAAGVFGMIGGQTIDLACEGKQVDLDTLRQLYALKTGALLSVAAQLGCIAGNAENRICRHAQEYAAAFGLAFQITDDILDVTGDEKMLGKPVGSDFSNEKTTYVTLLGVDGAKKEAQEQISKAKEHASQLEDPGFLLWLADMVLTRDH